MIKIKNIKFFTLLLLVSIILVGCSTGGDSGENEGLNKEEVVEELEEQSKDLRSVSGDVELTVEREINGETEKIVQFIDTVFLYSNEGAITDIHTKQKAIAADNSEQFAEFYKTPEVAYVYDGRSWQKYNGQEDYGTTYKPVIDTLIGVSGKLDMDEDDDHYSFTFKGKDAQIFNIVKIPFNIYFDGVEPEEIELDVSFKINKENMYLEDVFVGTTNNKDENNIDQVSGMIKFFDFNETKNIEVPADIKE